MSRWALGLLSLHEAAGRRHLVPVCPGVTIATVAVGIRLDDQVAIGMAHPCAAQANRLHHAVNAPVQPDAVADIKGLIQKYRDGGDDDLVSAGLRGLLVQRESDESDWSDVRAIVGLRLDDFSPAGWSRWADAINRFPGT